MACATRCGQRLCSSNTGGLTRRILTGLSTFFVNPASPDPRQSRGHRGQPHDGPDVDRSEDGRAGYGGALEGRVPDVADASVAGRCVDRPADTLRAAARDLALQRERVDDPSAVVSDGVL